MKRVLRYQSAKALVLAGILLLLELFCALTFAQTQSSRERDNMETLLGQEPFSIYTPENQPMERNFTIAQEQPGGVAQRVYFFYEDPDVAMRSYAAVDIGGCSGTMIGPNVMMTAGHCGGPNKNATFRLYTAANTQITESFSCQYLLTTWPDTDLQLYWCSANTNSEHPGDKYGYLDFDIVVDPVSGLFNYSASRNLLTMGTDLYSIWMNPIDSLGPGWYSIYSKGEISNLNYPSWYTPNINTGGNYLCGNSGCVGGNTPDQNCDLGGCGQPCNGGTCQGRPSQALGVGTDLWAQPGVSGSSQIREATHRILVGPLSVSANDARGRSSLSIADDLYWAITDANVGCPTCCVPCVADQINQTLLSSLGISNPAFYYGWADGTLDGVFDVQHDLERLRGENSREWYWLGFESNRRNGIWDKHAPAVVTFYISDPSFGQAYLSTLGQTGTGYIPVLSHERLNLTSERYYRISFLTYLTQFQTSTPIRVCLEGSEIHCADSNPLMWTWGKNVFRLWASPGAKLRFYLQKGTELYLAEVALISDSVQMNFDSHDKRSLWSNWNIGGQARIWPNGKTSSTQPDWAGVAYRDSSRPLNDDWSLSSSLLAIDGGSNYRVCFEYRNSDRDPLTGNIQGKVRMLNEFGEISNSTTLFSPGTNWVQTCTLWFSVPTDDNRLQFGVQASDSGAKGAYLVDNIVIECQPLNIIYVDWRNLWYMEDGTLTYPYSSVGEGIDAVSNGGSVLIFNGSYPETLIVRKPVTLEANGGPVIIGE